MFARVASHAGVASWHRLASRSRRKGPNTVTEWNNEGWSCESAEDEMTGGEKSEKARAVNNTYGGYF